MKFALSTIACPDWTLDEIASKAAAWGYQGVELRTFGNGCTHFACDPALTSYTKTRAMFDRAGLSIACLATGVRYDDPVTPPVIGYVIGDNEASVRETKSAVELAQRLGCPFVRVFAFEVMGSEKRSTALRRICDRLRKGLDTARNTGVRLLIENGGSFGTAADLAEIVDRCGNPLLATAYHVGVGARAGETPGNAFNVLGESLASVKLSDYHDGRPCMLGSGETPNQEAVETLAKLNYDGWVVYEYPRAWLSDEHAPLADPSEVLAAAARTMFSWMGAMSHARRHGRERAGV
jgi:sugar phosphate isomerase/epimerase